MVIGALFGICKILQTIISKLLIVDSKSDTTSDKEIIQKLRIFNSHFIKFVDYCIKKKQSTDNLKHSPFFFGSRKYIFLEKAWILLICSGP